MSDSEKLKIACESLRLVIHNQSKISDVKNKWVEFALRGSVQTRALRARANFRK